MNSVSIFYNGNEVWGTGSPIMNGQPTPFFGKSVEYIEAGERWCQAENWTLEGMVTGCDFSDLENSRQSLLSGFSSAFGEMQISGSEGLIFGLDIVEVKSISIDESDFIGSLPYSIQFTNYPSGSFQHNGESGFYGIINPSDSITYTESEDGTMEMQREISAKGFLTNPNDKDSAINNAKSFISSRRDRIPKPFLIRNSVDEGAEIRYYLVSSEESINRISNEISLRQKFKTDLNSLIGEIVHRYSFVENSEMGALTSVNYDGRIDVGELGDMDAARETYKNFRDGINAPFLLDESVTEDKYAGSITYKLSFYKDVDENNFPEIQDSIIITLSEEAGSSLMRASINGSINANYGCVEDRAEKIKAFLETVRDSTHNFELIKELYENFYTTRAGCAINKPNGISLNENYVSKSESFNEYNNTASYSAEFNDRFIPAVLSGCINVSEGVSIDYSTAQRAIKEHYKGGRYICQNLGFNSREKISTKIGREGVNRVVGNEVITGYLCSVARGFRTDNRDRDRPKEYWESPSYSLDRYGKSESAGISLTYNTDGAFEV